MDSLKEQIKEGLDGWLFLTGGEHRTIDLYKSESTFTPAHARQWVELLRRRGDQLNAQGIDYVHISAPDKLTLLNRHYGEALENPDGSPIRQLVTRHEAELPDFLNVVPYLSRNIDKYPVFWKTDNHWTAWGCFMAYQMICSRAGIPTNTGILNYPFSEHEERMGLARFDSSLSAEKIRTYQLNRYSHRVYANQVVRYRENLDLDRVSRSLLALSQDAGALAGGCPAGVTDSLPGDLPEELPGGSDPLSMTSSGVVNGLSLSHRLSGCHGAHVIYRNESDTATDKCVVLFGDDCSHYQPHLLTGMLAETVREVHFVWSRDIDHEYVRQVRPDVVISEVLEASMIDVPQDQGFVSTWAEVQLQTLESTVAQLEDSGLDIRAQAIPGLRSRRTLIMSSECYQLDPPVMVQQGNGGMHQELAMRSNEISLIDLDQARLYFSGERCLLRSAGGRKIFAYAVDGERERYLLHQNYRQLPGRSFLLAPSAGAHCYYHWMLDILPKLGLLERQGIALESIDHFIVRKITSRFQRETLTRLGIDPGRIRETIDDQYLLCDNLLHIDMDNCINMKMHRFVPLWLKHQGQSWANSSHEIDSGAGTDSEMTQDTSLVKHLIDSENRLKLYIGRPPGVRRGLLNEHEIKPIVEAAGFTMVCMEGLSVAEQVALLSRTDALIAPHGGALTNMVFCKPGIPVVEIFGRHVFPYYYGLAAMCGHRYHAILQDPENDHARLVNTRIAQSFADNQWESQNQSFNVDPAVLKAMLATLPTT